MARTHTHMKGRKQRQLAKAWVSSFNNDRSQMNKIDKEQQELGVSGIRYGNKRRAMAETKVLERRVERKKLNRNIEPD